MLEFLLICKNNENYFKYIFPVLLNKLKILEPIFYIYENNSTDNTKELLENLTKKYKNIIIKSENILITNNRYINICYARNNLISFFKEKRDKTNYNKWIVLFDTNIIFNSNTILELINNSYNGKMILSNTKYYSDNEENNNKYYYDLLAYNYGKNFINKKNINFDTLGENIIEIKTGFGGLGLIDKEEILKIKWTLNKNPKSNIKNITCEHWNFCDKINLINNNIFIITNAKALWFTDKYINDEKYNKDFYNYINKIF